MMKKVESFGSSNHGPCKLQFGIPPNIQARKCNFGIIGFLNVTREHFFDVSDERKAQSEDAYINMWGMLGELDKERMRKNLSIPMTAVKDAPFSPQKVSTYHFGSKRESRCFYQLPVG